MKVTLESFADGMVRICCVEQLGITNDGGETDTDVTLSVTARSLREAIPQLIQRFAAMQEAVIEGLRTLGVTISMEHEEKEMS